MLGALVVLGIIWLVAEWVSHEWEKEPDDLPEHPITKRQVRERRRAMKQ